jgi:hypothetical protein
MEQPFSHCMGVTAVGVPPGKGEGMKDELITRFQYCVPYHGLDTDRYHNTEYFIVKMQLASIHAFSVFMRFLFSCIFCF